MLIVTSAVLASFPVFQGQTFAYLEDKMYCKVEGEQLTLYVKKEEGLNKCDTYIDAIQQLAREKYDDVLRVISYINQSDDKEYWREVFEIKKQEFLKLVKYRTTILNMIQEFEQKFLVKYQEALRQTLTPYLHDLITVQETFEKNAQSKPQTQQEYIIYQQVTQQILVIESIFTAATLDEIIDQIPAYLYLKQALE